MNWINQKIIENSENYSNEYEKDSKGQITGMELSLM